MLKFIIIIDWGCLETVVMGRKIGPKGDDLEVVKITSWTMKYNTNIFFCCTVHFGNIKIFSPTNALFY